MSRILLKRRQIWIKESQSVWRFDHSNASSALLFDDMIAKHLHSCPMHLRPEMMLRVITVKKPYPIVKLVITTHAPCKRLIWITAVVAVVAVKVRKTMSEIPERKKKTDVMPVEDPENDKC